MMNMMQSTHARTLRIVALLCAAAFVAPHAHAQIAAGDWRVHTPEQANETFRITGNPSDGKVTMSGSAGSFVYIPIEKNFQIDARLVSLNVAGHDRWYAGLRLAEGLDDESLRSAIEWGQRPNNAEGDGLQNPRWIRIIRLGHNVGVYVSQDGHRYRNQGKGRTIRTEDGRVYVGLALFGGTSDQPMTATLDRIELSEPNLEYATSWVGNSLPGPVEDTVNFNMTSLYTTPDGTCYVTSFFEEQGHSLAAYHDGKQIAPDGKTPANGGTAIAVNDKYVFAAEYKHRGREGSDFNRLRRELKGRDRVRVSAEGKGDQTVRGLAANNEEVFASNRIDNRIEVYDAETLEHKRGFEFTRPGPLVLDGKGKLWVIREGFEEKTFEYLDGPYPHDAEIVCLDARSGRVVKSFQGPEVPTGVAIDPRGRLLVADNGPDQQVKIYDVSGEPKLVGTVGTQGGIFAGTPGKVADGKLNGLTGVGADSAGNIYVTSTGWPFMYVSPGLMANATTLRCFPPEASNKAEPKVDWRLDSIAYIFDGGTLDPRDETELYAGADQLFKMDWSKSRGEEGTYHAFTTNAKDFPLEALGRRTRETPWVRWLEDKKFLFLRGAPGLVAYRFEPGEYGETAVPAAAIGTRAHPKTQVRWLEHEPVDTGEAYVWMDGTNGQPRDGKDQPEEYVSLGKLPTGPGNRWDIDDRGDLWFTGFANPRLVRIHFTGIHNGVPTWDGHEVYDPPAPFLKVQRSRYDADSDTMILAGNTPKYVGGADIRWRTTHVARYENWSRGNRESSIEITLSPEPGDAYMDGAIGFDVVGDFLYTTGRPGNIMVYDLKHGNRVMEFVPGPEVNGNGGYFDNDQSAVQAFRLSNGEHLALAQENGWCKILMYRWTPDTTPDAAPAVAPMVFESQMGSGQVKLRWRTPTCGFIKGYNVYRAEAGRSFVKVNDESISTPTYIDTSVTNGRTYRYQVSIVNAVGEGPRSSPVSVIPQEAIAEFVGTDEKTRGNWKGKYGSDGFYIVGDWESENNPNQPDYLRIDGGPFVRKSGHAPGYKPMDEERFLLRSAEGTQERATFPAGSGYADKQQSYLLEFTDGKTHRMTLYANGHPNGYATRITLVDQSSGEVLDTREIAGRGENQGQYISWDVSGAIRLQYNWIQGEGFGNYLAGFFFDPSHVRR